MAILQVPYSIDLDKLSCVLPETRDGETGGVLAAIYVRRGREHVARRELFPGDYRQLAGIISEGFKKAGREAVEAESTAAKGLKIVVPSDNNMGACGNRI